MWKTFLSYESEYMLANYGEDCMNYLPPKIRTAQPPVLVIGLGTYGISALKTVKRRIRTRFDNADKFMRFLALDSDRLTGSHFLKDEEYHDLSYQFATDHLPGYVTEWLHPALPLQKPMDEDRFSRQHCRLTLFFHVQAVFNKLYSALEPLRDVPGSIQVFVTASMAEAAGSGLLLDVAYLLRYAARQLGIENRVRSNAVLFMPEAPWSGLSHARDTYFVRAFAALKELDYWMQAPENNRSLLQQYSPALYVRWEGRPFDDCLLLSSVRDNPNVEDSIDQAVALITAVAGLDYTGVGGIGWYDQLRQRLRDEAARRVHASPACRRYTFLELCQGELPLREEVTQEAHLLAEAFQRYRDASAPSDEQSRENCRSFIRQFTGDAAAEFLRPIAIRPGSQVPLTEVLNDNLPPPHLVNADPAVAAFQRALEERACGEEADKLIKGIVLRMEQELVALFANLQKGPFYVAQLLNALPYVCEELMHPFETQEYHRLAASQKAANDAYRAFQYNMLFWFNHNSPAGKRYRACCEELYRSMRQSFEAKLLKRILEAMREKASHMNRNIFIPLCQAIGKLIHAHQNTDFYAPEYEPHTVPLADYQTLVEEATSTLTPQRADELLQLFLRDMMRPFVYNASKEGYETFDPKECWLDLTPTEGITYVRITHSIQRLLNDYFRPLHEKPLSDRWREAHGFPADGSPFTTQEIMNGLVPQLPLSDASAFRDDGQLTRYEMVIVPAGAVRNGPYPEDAHIVESWLPNRVMRLRMTDGCALHHYHLWKKCKEKYEVLRAPGVHLWEGARQNWSNLPDPEQP